jgi:hypothetical protein
VCPTEACACAAFASCLAAAREELATRRLTSGVRRPDMCAKSVLPPFASRMVRAMRISRDDVFADLGSGDGSVVFFVAWVTGAPSVGVELSEHNAAHALELWSRLRPRLERSREQLAARFGAGAVVAPECGPVRIVCGNLCAFLAEHLAPLLPAALRAAPTQRSGLATPPPAGHRLLSAASPAAAAASSLSQQRGEPSGEGDSDDAAFFGRVTGAFAAGRGAVWTANLLMPPAVNQFMAECFVALPPGCRVMAFADLYPHGRAASRARNPEPMRRFAMTDMRWTPGTVEWTRFPGMVHMYERVDVEA